MKFHTIDFISRNRVIPTNKIFIEQNSPEPKVKVMIPMYMPLQVSECKRCRKTIAKPKELIRIQKKHHS